MLTTYIYVIITNVVNNVGEEAECEEVEVIPYSKCISDVMAARASDRCGDASLISAILL